MACWNPEWSRQPDFKSNKGQTILAERGLTFTECPLRSLRGCVACLKSLSGDQFRLEAELWDPKPTAPPTIPRRMARVEMAAFQRPVPSLVGQDTSSPAEVKWSESHSVVSRSLWPHGLYSPWNSPGQNTGVGSLSLLQGIFPTQGLNPGLLHCRRILYQLSHKGSPRILEWAAHPFSRGPSWPRNLTGPPAWQKDSLPSELSEKPSSPAERF